MVAHGRPVGGSGAPSARVDYLDHDRTRLELAARLGARAIDRYRKRDGAYPITVDASADPEGLAAAVLALIADGRLRPSRVTTRVARFDEAPEALLHRGPKVVLTAT